MIKMCSFCMMWLNSSFFGLSVCSWVALLSNFWYKLSCLHVLVMLDVIVYVADLKVLLSHINVSVSSLCCVSVCRMTLTWTSLWQNVGSRSSWRRWERTWSFTTSCWKQPWWSSSTRTMQTLLTSPPTWSVFNVASSLKSTGDREGI